MKRVLKTNSKKGFTLLEVMLAVAVMSIASTMIMQGFIATMNCARNSTIYSRVGSSHYAELINNIAKNSQKDFADRTLEGGTTGSITFGSYDSGIYVWRLNNGPEVNVKGAKGNQREADCSNTKIDNRAAFFYIPTGADGKTSCKNGHVGEFRYCHFTYDDKSDKSWATNDFRCIHEMDEYSDPESEFYQDENHRYCFQYS